MKQEELARYIRNIPDFPRPGILFRDITPLLADARAFRDAVDRLAQLCPPETRLVAGVESRGFIFGAALAQTLGAGFIPIRKKGKLPGETASVTYDLEYGRDCLEVHRDAVSPGDPVVLADDLLATGGTAEAAARLLEKIGGRVLRAVFLVELGALGGRRRIERYGPASLVVF